MTPNDLKSDIRVALAAQAEARIELAASMLGAPPDKLAECDGTFWENLGPQMRQRLLTALGSSTPQSEPVNSRRRPSSAMPRKGRSHRLLGCISAYWQKYPTTLKSLGSGLIAALTAVAIGLLAFQPDITSPEMSWNDGLPRCLRLSKRNPDCSYHAEHALTWEMIAAQTNIPVEALRANNPEIQSATLKKGDVIFLVHPNPNR